MVVNRFNKLKEKVTANMKHILLLFFLLGFVLDAFGLPSVTNSLSAIIGGVYLLSATVLLIVRELVRSKLVDKNNTDNITKVYNMVSLMLYFIIGSLMSYVLIYYVRSSDIHVSGPLLLLIMLIVLLNEFVRIETRLILDTAIIVLAATLYFVFAIPFWLSAINDKIFLVSIVVSVIFSLFVTTTLHSISFKYKVLGKYKSKYYLNSLIFVPVFIGLLYFTNIIPAVPLAIVSADVYSGIEKDSSGNYILNDASSKNWNPFALPIANVNHLDSSVSFYSAVKAPVSLNTNISHSWQKYNSSTKSWDTIMNISFPIQGGREGGFRGYSTKSNITKGIWRVFVTTGNRHIGSFKFEVK